MPSPSLSLSLSLSLLTAVSSRTSGLKKDSFCINHRCSLCTPVLQRCERRCFHRPILQGITSYWASCLFLIVVWVCNFVDLVHSNNQRNACFRVLDCFDCLWHYAITPLQLQVQRYVRRLSTTSTHSSKRRVSRSIKERDHAVVSIYVVSTNVLRDTALRQK